jgi:hypothetical protein
MQRRAIELQRFSGVKRLSTHPVSGTLFGNWRINIYSLAVLLGRERKLDVRHKNYHSKPPIRSLVILYFTNTSRKRAVNAENGYFPRRKWLSPWMNRSSDHHESLLRNFCLTVKSVSVLPSSSCTVWWRIWNKKHFLFTSVSLRKATNRFMSTTTIPNDDRQRSQQFLEQIHSEAHDRDLSNEVLVRIQRVRAGIVQRRI